MYLEQSTNPILKSFASVYPMRKAQFHVIHRGESDKEKVVVEFLQNIVEKSDFSMCVPVKYFGAIVESDFVKNSMETGHCTTNGGDEVRIKALSNIYGIAAKGLAPADYPKYGILTGKNKVKDLIQDPDIFYHYGGVMLTLKKKKFIGRTTMTIGSSINFMESLLKTPVPLDDISPVCIKGMPTKPVQPGTPVFNGFGLFYDMIINNKINITTPNRLAMATDGFPGFENYELQFFGEIRFSTDVESVSVFPFSDEDFETVMAYKPTLDKYGITIENLLDGMMMF